MKITKIEEGGILFDDGTKIEDHHEQDCCENVYADFEALKDSGIMDEEIEKIEIEGVEDSGFRLNKHFVPCYDRQNGYYSSSLSLIITRPDGYAKTIDITKFVKAEHD